MRIEKKYVMVDRISPAIFQGPLRHADIKPDKEKITSAGFYEVVDGKVRTYGYSHSLKMGPCPKDAELIESFLGL